MKVDDVKAGGLSVAVEFEGRRFKAVIGGSALFAETFAEIEAKILKTLKAKSAKVEFPIVLCKSGGWVRAVVRGQHASRSSEFLITLADGTKDAASLHYDTLDGAQVSDAELAQLNALRDEMNAASKAHADALDKLKSRTTDLRFRVKAAIEKAASGA